MKKKYRKIILLIILIIIILTHPLNIFKIKNNKYEIIKQDKNSNYSGIGQEKISNKDGYYTTFTTNTPYKKTYIEYKQNGNASWSKNTYWNDTMEKSGCGITAMAIILSGYGNNVTPEDLRNKYYPVLDYESLSTELNNSYGIKSNGFYYDSTHLSKKYIKNHLLTNRPIIVCVWNHPNENRWTTASHYMVLLACDNKNMVYVSNPNGGKNDIKSSGWYKYDEIIPYIAKALFIENYQ